MAAPATVRVNVQVPFPALVTGTGPITITKVNGIWTVGFSFTAFGPQVPPSGNYPTDFLLVYDSIAKAYFTLSITNLLSTIAITTGAARTQRSVTASPITIATTDQILNCNISTGSPTCTLPSAASRVGVPLTFKDVGAQFGAHNLTITPAGADTIDGQTSLLLSGNRQAVTLVPFNDGINSGWSIE